MSLLYHDIITALYLSFQAPFFKILLYPKNTEAYSRIAAMRDAHRGTRGTRGILFKRRCGFAFPILVRKIHSAF